MIEKTLKKVSLDKEYTYLIETDSRYPDCNLDYSQYITIPVLEDLVERVQDFGGHAQTLIKEMIHQFKQMTHILVFSMQTSPVSFVTTLCYMEQDTLLEYRISAESQFYNFIKDFLNEGKLSYYEGTHFEKLQEKPFEQINSYLYLPKNAYGTGFKTSDNKEVLFGETYQVPVTDSNKELIKWASQLSEQPIVTLELSLKRTVTFNYFCNLSYILEDDTYLNYGRTFFKEEFGYFNETEYQTLVSNFELYFAWDEALLINKRYEKMSKQFKKETDLDERNYLYNTLYSRLESYDKNLQQELSEYQEMYHSLIGEETLACLFEQIEPN